jgi:RimJ/RimL family protein N-acetyltransferase
MEGLLRHLAVTERLTLLAPASSEFPLIDRLWTDALATKYIGGPRDLAVVHDHFTRYAADPVGFAAEEHEWWWSVVQKADASWVGLCALVQKVVEGKIETDLGYFLLPAHWRQGFATEALRPVLSFAFVELGLESVIAIIHSENEASAAVARRLGMQLDRQTLRMDGVIKRMYRLWRSDDKKVSSGANH